MATFNARLPGGNLSLAYPAGWISFYDRPRVHIALNQRAGEDHSPLSDSHPRDHNHAHEENGIGTNPGDVAPNVK